MSKLTLCCLVVLILTVLIHIGTFFPSMHLGSALGFPIIIAVLIEWAIIMPRMNEVPPEVTGWKRKFYRRDPSTWIRFIPWPLLILFAGDVAYTFVNFSMSLNLFGGSNFNVDDQNRLFINHQFVRVLSQSEVDRVNVHFLRAFSGHCILFAFMAYLGAAYILPAVNRDRR